MSVQTADLRLIRRRATSGPRDVVASAAGVVLVALFLACFLLPLVLDLPSPTQGDLAQATLRPLTPGHVLGTDPLGFDILSRVLHGGRVSFIVGFAATALSLVVGTIIGVCAGYLGGLVDRVAVAVLNVLLAFPALVLALVIAAFLGPSLGNEVIAVSFFLTPAMARISRASTLSVRSSEFNVAARLAGRSGGFIMVRHIFPNIASTLLTFAILQVGIAMIIEATLSFLGLGVRPPTPSWGNMISAGQEYLSSAPWVSLVPGAFLFFVVCALNLLGESVRSRRDRS